MEPNTAYRPRQKMVSQLFVSAALLLGGGCGTGSSPDIGGTWTLAFTLAAGSYGCSVQAGLSLQTNGTSITGTLAEEQANCADGGQPVGVELQTLPVAGELDGDRINFATQMPPGEGGCAFEFFDGEAQEESMSGAVETRPVFCQGTFTKLSGTWEAQRR